MPLILYYIADRGAGRASDALFCAYLQIWHLLEKEPELKLVTNVVSDSEMIGNFPAEAYDMHTREGRFAIRRFETEYCVKIRLTAQELQNLCFQSEGGLLAKMVTCSSNDRIGDSALKLELGVANIYVARGMVNWMSNSIFKLNNFRLKFAK